MSQTTTGAHPDATSAPSDQALVHAVNVTKAFHGTEVLKGIDMDVHRGEVVVLCGPSGSGKTTFLRCINQLETIDGGRIFVDGDLMGYEDRGGTLHRLPDKRIAAQRRDIGMCFQRFNLFPTLTAEGNLRLAERIHGNSRGDESRRREVLRLLRLEGKMRHKPLELSGGEQQRVALARAIINRPAIILADEPTGNLDTENSAVVLDMLGRLNGEFGQTIVMITHNPEAAAIAGRTVEMRDGMIVREVRGRE